MASFLRGLMADLDRRCTVLEDRLQDSAVHPDVREHAREARDTLASVQRDIRAIVEDPAFDDPALQSTYSHLYRRLHEEVRLVRSLVVPALERYNEHDARLTALMRRLTREVNWPIPRSPLVVASSDVGYSTTLGLDIIFVDAADDDVELAWPDLCHEMGHVLINRFRGLLVGPWVDTLDAYLTKAEKANPLLRETYGDLLEAYSRGWLDEFVCDMVATYLCGPAYGSQHLRLVASMRGDIYEHGEFHPADEARMRGIALMLDEMNHSPQASDVRRLWTDYMKPMGQFPSEACYGESAPDVILSALAKQVAEGCRQMGLVPFDSPTHGKDSVVGLLNQSWRKFLTDPVGYPAWEASRLKALWTQLGLGNGGKGSPSVA